MVIYCICIEFSPTVDTKKEEKKKLKADVASRRGGLQSNRPSIVKHLHYIAVTARTALNVNSRFVLKLVFFYENIAESKNGYE